jgi:GDP-L-fucose synthase
MTILVTGGSGLLGSSLNIGLKPTKDELNLINYDDLCKYIEKNNITSIIHAAARVGGVKSNIDYSYDFFSENVQMSLNIMNACKKYKINKSIYIVSTCAFPSESPLPLKESYIHNGEPHSTNYGYAYAKRLMVVGSKTLNQQYKLSSTCLIPCNFYGENDNYNLEKGHVIPSLINKCYLAKMNDTPLEVWGSGNAEREFIYIKDFSAIIEMIIENNLDISEPLIVSPDSVVSIKQLVKIISKKLNFSGEIIFDKNKPEGIAKKNSDNSLFKSYFPDFKFTSLDEGLENTINFYIKNFNSLRK